MTETSNASLRTDSNKMQIVISSDDWFAWLASLGPAVASITVQIEEPRSGELVGSIINVNWPTRWVKG